MQSRVEVHFQAVEITAQHVLGEPGDNVDAVVHFSFRFPDGRIDTNCTATIWHRLEANGEDLIQVTVPAAYQCPAYGPGLERAIEAYYRPLVGTDGTVIRVGPKGVSPLIVGVPRESVASASFEVEPAFTPS